MHSIEARDERLDGTPRCLASAAATISGLSTSSS
jgi:hypothetical protein